MGIFSHFPYTDFHRLNADWILEKVKEAAEAVAESLGLVRQSAADAAAAAAAAEQTAAGSVRYDRVQDLTTLQQGQARDNIQAAPADMFGAVRYDMVQLLEDPQKARARSNIGAAETGVVPSGAVRYDVQQQLSVIQAAQARLNIGAAEAGAAPDGVVRYDVGQSLTTAQKTQARSNIGALQADDPTVSNLYIADGTTEIQLYADPSSSLLYLDGFSGSTSGLAVRLSGVATPTSGNDAANKDYADSIRGPLLSNIAGADVILQPDAVNAKQSTLYVCTAAELNSLEINPVSAPAANREFTVRFTSGATPTELDTDLTILGLDDLVPAANTIYEINVLGNLAVWHSWEVPA